MINWKLIKYLGLFVALCACAPFSNLAYADQQIKEVDVNTRVMRFPKLQLDGLDYQSLRAQYAVVGQLTVLDDIQKKEMLSCSEPTEDIYWEVSYKGPIVLFRMLDVRRDKIVYQTQFTNEATGVFGRDGCAAKAEPTKEDKAQWLAELEKQFLSESRAKIDAYLQEDTALRYEDIRFPFYYVVDGGTSFEQLNNAFDQARIAFDLNMETGITVEGTAMLENAARVFEDTLKGHNVLASPFDYELKRALHQNLSAIYFMLSNFDYARRHDARALADGMDAKLSLQALILDHERRHILSPKVVSNTVLTANLFRLGNNAVSDIVPVELTKQEYEVTP